MGLIKSVLDSNAAQNGHNADHIDIHTKKKTPLPVLFIQNNIQAMCIRSARAMNAIASF